MHSNVTLSGNETLSGSQLARLHTFEVAARHLSFAMAAQELSLTPSAISHRISGLEEELGFKLFIRFHRQLKLTDEGQRIYASLSTSLATIRQEISEIKNHELSGSLTIYARPSITQCWLVPKLAEFHSRYPSIKMDILTGNENVNFKVHNIDLALYYDNNPPFGVYHQELMCEEIVPVCSREYAERHDLFNKPKNLSNCTLLHDNQAWAFTSGKAEWHYWASSLGISSLNDDKYIGFDRSDLAIIAAINHAGVAMGRKTLIQKRLVSGELVKPFPDLSLISEHKYYIILPNEQPASRVKVFISWLKEKARESN